MCEPHVKHVVSTRQRCVYHEANTCMLNMCLVTRVFLQVNACLISKMKGIRHEHVSHDDQEEKKKSKVCNIISH
jgi:hypothetical protein